MNANHVLMIFKLGKNSYLRYLDVPNLTVTALFDKRLFLSLIVVIQIILYIHPNQGSTR